MCICISTAPSPFCSPKGVYVQKYAVSASIIRINISEKNVKNDPNAVFIKYGEPLDVSQMVMTNESMVCPSFWTFVRSFDASVVNNTLYVWSSSENSKKGVDKRIKTLKKKANVGDDIPVFTEELHESFTWPRVPKYTYQRLDDQGSIITRVAPQNFFKVADNVQKYKLGSVN
jgi:hypothetical protein